MSERNIYTYVMPREFRGYNIPISIQSQYIKNYAETNGYKFMLPVTELIHNQSYNNFIEFSKKNILNLAMTSIFVLPVRDIINCKKITKKFSNKCIFHFVLENLKFNKKDLLNWIFEFNKIDTLIYDYKSFNETKILQRK